MVEYVRPFSQLQAGDTHHAGGKGASLGEMTQAGIPVPPGYVLLTTAFEQFLDANDLHQEIETFLGQVNHHELGTVERASAGIQGIILRATIPDEIAQAIYEGFDALGAEWVAVRSSATAEDGADASWAGELESYLNTSRDSLLENVRRCWASLFTPRAIFYRFEKGFHTGKVSVAVVVQKMAQADISGIAFSVHPVTEDPNQLIIEAGYGLGEAIVSGSVTPDNYVLDKRDWTEVDMYLSSQERALYRAEGGGSQWQSVASERQSLRKLDSETTRKLAELVVRIEQHYDFPCDIEWAVEGEALYIVQSRPITTLTKH